ncbi:MAG: ABC transporter ATP-binding protein [Alkaliphilus sp.]
MKNIIEVNEVSISFKGVPILTDINLSIKKGSMIGIIGSNGVGKSVLFKIICGFLKADKGEIHIRGEKLGVNFDFPSDVGVIINKPGYIETFNGFKNLKFLADINKKIGDNKIKATLELVGLDPNNKTRVKHYSTGMKQKLGIAQAIMEDQDIFIFDEPFNGLDFKTANETRELLLELKEGGKTILLTSHTHSDIEKLCDEVYLLMNAKLHELTDEMKKEYFG